MFRCRKCRVRVRVRLWPFRCVCGCRYEHAGDKGTCRDIATSQREPYVWPPNGVGTVLKAMIAELNVAASEGCGCEAMARQMNEWGPDGCRKNLPQIAAKLKANARQLGLQDWPSIIARCVGSTWLRKIHPCSPFESLIYEAIRRAEAMPAATS